MKDTCTDHLCHQDPGHRDERTNADEFNDLLGFGFLERFQLFLYFSQSLLVFASHAANGLFVLHVRFFDIAT